MNRFNIVDTLHFLNISMDFASRQKIPTNRTPKIVGHNIRTPKIVVNFRQDHVLGCSLQHCESTTTKLGRWHPPNVLITCKLSPRQRQGQAFQINQGITIQLVESVSQIKQSLRKTKHRIDTVLQTNTTQEIQKLYRGETTFAIR